MSQLDLKRRILLRRVGKYGVSIDGHRYLTAEMAALVGQMVWVELVEEPGAPVSPRLVGSSGPPPQEVRVCSISPENIRCLASEHRTQDCMRRADCIRRSKGRCVAVESVPQVETAPALEPKDCQISTKEVHTSGSSGKALLSRSRIQTSGIGKLLFLASRLLSSGRMP